MEPRTKHPDVLANLVLIGGRGCGKSSVSKRIALTNRGFMLFSLDAMIRYEAKGLTVPEIVEQQGWAEFRELEYEVVNKLTRMDQGLVIDCGGGVVVDLDESGDEMFSLRKVEALRSNGLVFYLDRDPEYLVHRIAGDPNRPDLSETKSFLEIMARREPWYREAAHHVIKCDDLDKQGIADEVLQIFYDSTGVDLESV
jgi:shikimate kinase